MQIGAQVANDAVQGILSRIDTLAAKLDTTAANVWQIYVAQAKVEAVRDTIFGAVLFLLGLLFFGAAYSGKDDADEGIAPCIFLGAVSLVASGFWFYPALGEWINPQYWAFQHLTEDLKNLL